MYVVLNGILKYRIQIKCVVVVTNLSFHFSLFLTDLMNGGQFSSDEYLVVTDPDGVNMSQQQYREPPPYPGHSRQLQNTPGNAAHCLLKYMH